MNPSSPPWAVLAGCLIFSACRQTDGYIQLATSPRAVTSASVVGDSNETQWQYLAAKYDSNGDAQITTAEYDRSAKTFAGFDRDSNGVLEATDFEREQGRGGMQPSPADMRRRMSPMILAKYFQSDDDESTLVRAELDAAFATYDTDDSGTITREEFEAQSQTRGATASRQMDRFAMLVGSAASENANEFSLMQLTTYFDTVAGGGKLRAPRMMGMGRGGRAEGAAPPADDAPNAVGKLAPDFALPKLHGTDGEALVRLSSFRGKRPVALIFGSYT